MTKQPNYVGLRAVARQAEKEAPLTTKRYFALLDMAKREAGDEPQLVEFMAAYMPDELANMEPDE